MPLRRTLAMALAGWSLVAVLCSRAAAASSPALPPQEQPASNETPLLQWNGRSGYEGLTVEEVRFPGIADPEDVKRFTELAAVKAGAPLDREQLRQSIQALFATGRFAEVRAEAEHGARGGVLLSFVTAPNFFVAEVRVEGNPARPTASQVINASKLQLGELFTPDRVDRALNSIRQLLEENGYYRAAISESEDKRPQTQEIGILFKIEPGTQAHFGAISVTGSPGYPADQIRDIAKIHPGDPISSQKVNSALDRLRRKYQKKNRWLSQVTISDHSYQPSSNSVNYTFDIQPGPVVNVTTEGFRIRKGVLRKQVPVYEENALDDDLLNEGRRNLLNYLQSRGYFEAHVTFKKTQDANGQELRVIYDIDPGARHRLARVLVTGNHYFDAQTLRSYMQVQPAGRVLSSGLYSQALLNDDIRGLEGLYKSNGFGSVKITSNVTDNYEGKKNQLALTLKVEEGPQTLVGSLHLIGNHAIGEEKILELINTHEGQPFSESGIADDRDILLSYYFNTGFPDASFEAAATPTPGAANRMDVSFTISEGRRVFVDHVRVSGTHYTRPYIVHRELQMKSGDALSQLDMLETQRRLYDLGIFEQVDTAVQNPEGVEDRKNVLVQVQEARRYTFNYGLGLEFQTGQPSLGTNQAQGETGLSPRVSFDVTRLNFRGRNHTVTFSTHVGRLQQRALVSYDAPRWLNSSHWKLDFTAFYDNTLDVTTFTSERLEGSVQAEQSLGRGGNMEYRFTYRRVQATNLPANLSQVPLLSQPVRVGGPGFTYIRDRRDNAIESTKGTYMTVDGSLASSYFGSEADFSRVFFQHSSYYSFGKNRPAARKYVFARSLRIGVETPFQNTVLNPPGQCPTSGPVLCVPLPELFLSGGGNSHRGFGLNQAGPRDPITGFPVGGGALFLNNLELRFPSHPLPFVEDNLSFAIFHDAGNVFTNGTSMLNNLLRWKQKDPQLCQQPGTAAQCNYSYISHAIGVGVRYKTPIGPVRFDFGYNMNPPAFPSVQTTTDASGQTISTFKPQQTRRFNVFFSIGQTF